MYPTSSTYGATESHEVWTDDLISRIKQHRYLVPPTNRDIRPSVDLILRSIKFFNQ